MPGTNILDFARSLHFCFACWITLLSLQTIPASPSYPKAYRGNLRLITNDQALATLTWQRMQHVCPPTLVFKGVEWVATGLNPHWRLSKYYSGDVFKEHCDSAFIQSDDIRSFYTVNIYLNDTFSLGGTRFFREPTELESAANEGCESRIRARVQPRPGLALIFAQPGLKFYGHDGERVEGGEKYLIRSDVMYKRAQK
jgi:prolyl 4-hydroxylase